MGTWLPELELNATDQKNILTAFTRLKDRLGNEWAVVGSNNFDTASLLTTLGGASVLTGLSSVLSPTAENMYYGLVKDGATTLNDLETAIKTEFNATTAPATPVSATPAPATTATAMTATPVKPTPPASTAPTTTIARIKLAGFDALEIKENNPEPAQISGTFYIINKNNLIVIGTSRAQLEASLTATPLLENPLFKGIAFPSRLTGMQFSAPVRLTRAAIDKSLSDLIKTFALEKDVPANALAATGDWLESWSSRTQVSYGNFVVDGNKLKAYSKSGFSWNK